MNEYSNHQLSLALHKFMAGRAMAAGIYAAMTVTGWRILEWHQGEWWFPDRHAKWGAAKPTYFVGPLEVPEQEYDL